MMRNRIVEAERNVFIHSYFEPSTEAGFFTRPWPALRAGGPRWDCPSNTVWVGKFWDCLYDLLRAFGTKLGLKSSGGSKGLVKKRHITHMVP